MGSEEAKLKLSSIQVKCSNQAWQISRGVFDSSSIEESASNSRLILAIVSDLCSRTVVGYHIDAKESTEVTIAALLYAICCKNYPFRHDSPDPWITGCTPPFLLTDGGNELTNNLTSLAHFSEN